MTVLPHGKSALRALSRQIRPGLQSIRDCHIGKQMALTRMGTHHWGVPGMNTENFGPSEPIQLH